MPKYGARCYAPGTNRVVAQVLIEAENIRDAHNRAFAKIREDFPGIEPAAHDSLIVETVTSFIEPDTASRCV